jgi:serine/threonine protein kinase
MRTGSGTVFISYRRDDSSGYAGRVYDRLEARLGHDQVVMDVDSMELGIDFVDQINRLVSGCVVMIAIIGPAWDGGGPAGKRRIDRDNDYVRLEVEAALSRGIPVIPVLVEAAEMPDLEALPLSLRPLVRRHGQKLRHERFHADVESLVGGIERLLAEAERTARGESQPPLVRQLPQPGEEFAGYKVESVIGSGASGLVYRTSRERPARQVALKVMIPKGADDAQLARMREEFLREGEIAAKLEHPHVIPIYEYGELDGLLFIAMRYVADGYNLAHLLGDGPLEPTLAAELALQIGSALDAAHERELVHCDLKPANVLVARDGPRAHAYLTDFGVASTSGASVEVARGTLDYCAPEQFRGEPLDARTDVYSLGCIVYEMLSGAPPFRTASREATMLAHVNGERPLLTDSRPDLPPTVAAVVSDAIAANPDQRPRSAGELASHIANAIAASGSAPPALEPSTPAVTEELAPPRLPALGETFAGYKLEARIGNDDVTEVFRGRHVHHGRLATIKIMSPQLALDPSLRDRFARQQALMARIEHPGIVPVYALGEENGTPYVAMRHVDAPTLEELLASDGRFDPPRACRLIKQVATTLDALHDAGILHRNVKPAAIIVEGHGPAEHTYLTDIGLSHHEGMEMLTPAESFVDNFQYLAPELAKGEAVGPPADEYALGCVLFELLTGTPPLRHENKLRTMYAHMTEPRPSARELVPSLPEDLDAVIKKAMAKAPGERYASAGGFATAALSTIGNRT